MMMKNEISMGQLVMFGRVRGERTLGKVVKVNRQRVKVVQLTKRGSLKNYPVGTIWMVPPTLITPASAEECAMAEEIPEGVDTKKPVSIEEIPGTAATASPTRQTLPDSTEKTEVEAAPSPESAPIEPKKRGRKPRAKEDLSDTMSFQEKGCPVIVDPNTGYRFVGHKGESVLHFAVRVQDILRGNLTPSEKAEVASHNLH